MSLRAPKIPPWFTQDMYLYAEFRRLEMLLMAHNPNDAELYALACKPLDNAIRARNGVVRWEETGHVPHYIVVRDGTRYVTETKPEWISDAETVTWQTPEHPSPLMLQRLRRLGRAIVRVSPDLYEIAEIARRVERMDVLTKGESEASLSVEQQVGELVGDLLHVHSTFPVAIIEHSRDFCNRVTTEFMMSRVTGDVAKVAVGTLTFFMLHPRPEMLRQAALQPPGVADVLTAMGKNHTAFIPVLEIDYYLSHPKSVGRASLVAARGAARWLRQQGKDYCRSAVDNISVVEFYENLHRALLAYLAAQEIYRQLLTFGHEVPAVWDALGIDEEEIRRYSVETEEARVSIIASFVQGSASWLHAASPSRPRRLFGYVAGFLKSRGFEGSEMLIHDHTVRLLWPEPIRDLALALLSALSGQSTDRWRRRSARIVERLENDLHAAVGRGDPNYLHHAYGICAGLHRQAGFEDAAANFETRLDGLPARLRAILELNNRDQP